MITRQIIGLALMAAAMVGAIATLIVIKTTEGTHYIGDWYNPTIIPEANYVMIWIAISASALVGFVAFYMPQINPPQSGAPK